MNRMKQHDTAPPLVATLTDAGTPIDLTAATGIKVIGSQAGAVKFSRTVTGSNAGVVQMPWQAADTATPGVINIEVEVTWPGNGGVQSFPASGYLTVIIERDLG